MRAMGLVVLCLLLPACASRGGGGASPEAGPGYDRAGFYAAAAGLAGLQEFSLDPPFSGSNGNGGAALRFGYRGEHGVAGELFVEDDRGFEVDADPFSTRVEFRSLGLQGKFFLSGGRFQPFVLVGGGWTQAHFRDRPPVRIANDAFFYRGGLGADWCLTPDVALFAEGNYNFLTKHLGPFDHLDLLLGVEVRF